MINEYLLNGKSYHLLNSEDVLHELQSNVDFGLNTSDANIRLKKFGPNKLPDSKMKSALKILLQQFTDLFVIILMISVVISFFLGEKEDTIAILAIILMNGILGFVQEFRAEKAMEKLRSLVSTDSTVLRDGHVQHLDATLLVPGDIVYLEAGLKVPADLRLFETIDLQIDESLLTGESLASTKTTTPLKNENLSPADQTNMAMKSTLVVKGRGKGIVVATGFKTQIGKMAGLLAQENNSKTPLQQKLTALSKNIAVLIITLCAVIFLMGIKRGESPLNLFMIALSLAVAAIPEALPAIITIALALGASRMGKHRALVRKLSAIETLGAVTTVCTDKTGTLTLNQMHARSFFINNIITTELNSKDPNHKTLLQMMAQSNDAFVDPHGNLLGDPTETALHRKASDYSFNKSDLEIKNPRIAEVPFSSERQMMTTIHKGEDNYFVFCKGAPEVILPLCQDKNICTSSQEAMNTLSKKGERILAFASRTLPLDSELNLQKIERDLNFIALVGLIDPPRDEARAAIKECREAGINVIMITGDHPHTAMAMAEQLNLIGDESHNKAIIGTELAAMNEKSLAEQISNVRVFARVLPEQKIQLVKALQSKGEIVAMTGDGVNDAPALKRSEIGISMGLNGTDVAREASHIVLLDDNFATLTIAIKEGRRIYDNIRKFVRFALTGNSAEVWALFLAPLFGLPLPLLPIQILFVNLVTDGLPGLALGMEPYEKNIMKRPPRSPKEGILDDGLGLHCLWVGLLIAFCTLSSMAYAIHIGSPRWQTLAFVVLTFCQYGHVLAIRSEKESFFKQGIFSNPYLIVIVVLSILLQLFIIYSKSLSEIFKTKPLNRDELIIAFIMPLFVFFAVEFEKFIRRHKKAN